jgi:hypothetical protein
MLPLLLTLLAVDPQPAVLRIQASEEDAALSVRADAPGWSGVCPSPVTVDHPCELPAAPEGQFVDLRVSGTRAFDDRLLLTSTPATVRIEHRSYAATGLGLLAVAGAVAIIAAGVSTFRDGNESGGRMLISIGASVEAAGLIAILNDLTSTHDRAVVVK